MATRAQRRGLCRRVRATTPRLGAGLWLALASLPGAAFAQANALDQATVPPAAPKAVVESAAPLPETFEIGLSTETIIIASNFSGARLVVFGALDNADAKILRQGGYDIVVALEGPKTPIVVREKARVLGFWINRGSERFQRVPASYSLASTRRLADVAPVTLLQKLSVGVDFLQFGDAPTTDVLGRDEYALALRRIRGERGLFDQTFGAVEFVSATLFRADLALPANLPVGRHVARAFLFRNGVFLRERSQTLWVLKSGFESSVSNFAATHGLIYGLFAVALAIVTGWLGRLIFKRD